MFQLNHAGLLSQTCLQEPGDGTATMKLRWRRARGDIQTVEDQKIALGIVHHWELCNPLKVVERGKSVHFIVVHLVPGDEPTGVIGGNSGVEFHRAEVVADRMPVSYTHLTLP